MFICNGISGFLQWSLTTESRQVLHFISSGSKKLLITQECMCVRGLLQYKVPFTLFYSGYLHILYRISKLASCQLLKH